MNLLAIDTATDLALIGVSVAGNILDRSTVSGSSHSRDLLPSIEAAIGEAGISLDQLDGIIMGRGPGSFTGLRIAAGVVQGLAYGLEIPVALVSSMACLAQGFRSRENPGVVVALKARRREVYFGAYRFCRGLASPVGEEMVVDITAAPPLAGEWTCVGDGWSFDRELRSSTGVRVRELHLNARPALSDLVALGQGVINAGAMVPAARALPVYLREKVAAKAGE